MAENPKDTENSLWDSIEVSVKEDVTRVLKDNGLEDPEILVSSNQEAGNHFMSRLYKISATSKKDPTKKMKLILKQIPEDDELKNIVNVDELFNREIIIYTKMLVAFEDLQKNLAEKDKFQYVKSYKTKADGKTILLEDVSADGYEVLSDKGHAMDRDQVCMVLKNLARFHALSFAMKTKEPEKFKDLVDSITDYSYFDPFMDYINTVGEMTIDLIEDPWKRSRVEPHAINLFEKFLKDRNFERADPYNVVCHSDCWNNNLLFKYEDEKLIDLKIIDWQCCVYASPIIDIAHFFFTSTTSTFRRNHYLYILDYYYDQLQMQLIRLGVDPSSCYPRVVFLEHSQEIMTHGLTMSMIAMPFHTAMLGNVSMDSSCTFIITETKKSMNNECKKKLVEVVNDFIAMNLI